MTYCVGSGYLIVCYWDVELAVAWSPFATKMNTGN